MEEINVDSLWLIEKRDSNGKHTNIYHGNFVPQIPNNLIRRYTKENDIVLDLFMGSGTTLFECENLKRNFIGFDINAEILQYVQSKMDYNCDIEYCINNCDVTDSKAFKTYIDKNLKILNKENIDFFIAHPPYLDIIKFTDLESDLSHISDIQMFMDKLIVSINNAYNILSFNKYFAIVIGDVYKNSEVKPLAFYTMDAIKKHFNVKLKGIIVKNIEGNRGKLKIQNLWYTRALRSDYFIFKHEYIFVFKKIK